MPSPSRGYAAGSAYYVAAKRRNALPRLRRRVQSGTCCPSVPRSRPRPDGMPLAYSVSMRRCLTLVVGILIGQWLAFGAHPSPADLHTVGLAAWQRGDYPEALRLWSHGTALQPGDAVLHFWRASALARLGQRHAAADAFRLALVLDPPGSVAALARRELASLDAAATESTEGETAVPVEPSRGVRPTSVVVNGDRPARFLVHTGSSGTPISPALAGRTG